LLITDLYASRDSAGKIRPTIIREKFQARFRNNSAGRERAERAGPWGFCRKIPVNDYPEIFSGPVPE
jgi:hypothetical protein